MTNEEIANLLETVAELLEITSESPFKARAYLKAAQSIRLFNGSLYELAKQGRLEEIPGVGKSIASQIESYLFDGKMPILEQLSQKIPVQLTELLNIPYIGPKTARLLYENYGIKSIDELKEQILSGRLKKAKGVSSKTLGKLKRLFSESQIEFKRMLLSEAEVVVQQVVAYFLENYEEVKIIPAGSLRRGRETVGDLDFVVLGKDAQRALEDFSKRFSGSIATIKGEEVVRITGKKGLQYDFLITSEDSYGAALVHLTGSKEHNIKLRKIAKTSGGHLNQDGFVDSNGKLHPFRSEEELYAFFGLEYIEPELREDTGEIEAAKEKKLPCLIKLEDIKGDLHVHSDWSDGSGGLWELAEVGKHLGYRYLAITDHAKRLVVARGLSVNDIKTRNQLIEEINQKFRGEFYLLKGIELNIDKEGAVDYPQEFLEEFDLCLASLHWSLDQDSEAITRRLLEAMKNPYVDGIAHPTARLLLKRPPAAVDFDTVFKLASETGTFFEINAFPDRLDLPPELIRKAKDYGLKFFLGTDAHAVSHLALIKYGITTARRGWLEKEDIINTLELVDLLEEIRARRLKRKGLFR